MKERFAELKKIKVENAGGKLTKCDKKTVRKRRARMKPRGSGIDSDGCQRNDRMNGGSYFPIEKAELSRG